MRLDEFDIAYAVTGDLAMFFHGYRRFCESVELLVTRPGLRLIHNRLVGHGYVTCFAGSKNLRDSARGVRIEFLIAGQFPGDGKPKPVAFPNPSTFAVQKGGMQCLDLPRLIEIKLASGLTNPGRLRDLADVQELIRHVNLDRSLAEQLDPSVRDKYLELWDGIEQGGREP